MLEQKKIKPTLVNLIVAVKDVVYSLLKIQIKTSSPVIIMWFKFMYLE